MGEMYSFYCDESCHLENDGNDVMLLGAIWCPQNCVKTINQVKRRNPVILIV